MNLNKIFKHIKHYLTNERGTFGAVSLSSVALGAGVGAAGVGLGGMLGMFGGPKKIQYHAPSYYNDPNVSASENSLMPFASSLMSGQGLPSAYSGLITPNSPEFQAMLSRTTGNVLGATQSAMASQGIGNSGVALSAEAGAIGDVTSKLTWQDFLNSQANQMDLLKTGASIMGNVGNMALSNQGAVNQFNLDNAAADVGVQATNINNANQAQANWGSLMGSGLSSMSNMYGMRMLSNNGGFGTGGYGFSMMPGGGAISGGGGFIDNGGYGFGGG